MKYKNFKDCKEGDYVYIVEISNLSCQLKKSKIESFDTYLETKEKIYLIFDTSPMSFDMDKNSSSWHGMIFTTEEEAKKAIQTQCIEKIIYLNSLVENFANVLKNIDNLEFK